MSKSKTAFREKLIPAVVLEIGKLALPEKEAGTNVKSTAITYVLITTKGRELVAVATNGKCILAVTVRTPYDLPDHAGLYDAVELRKQSGRAGFLVSKDGLRFMDESTHSLANGKKPGKPELHLRPSDLEPARYPSVWRQLLDPGTGEPMDNFNMRLPVLLPYLSVMSDVQMFNASMPGQDWRSPGDVVFMPRKTDKGYRLHVRTKGSVPSENLMYVSAEAVLLGLNVDEPNKE